MQCVVNFVLTAEVALKVFRQAIHWNIQKTIFKEWWIAAINSKAFSTWPQYF
jgi:hypothetical protein